MRDCGCCTSENAVQVSNQASSSTNNNCSPEIAPAIQNTITCLYRTTLSTQKRFQITLTWGAKNPSSQTLTISFNQNPSTQFKINTNSGRFRSPKGSKSIDLHASKVEAHWDLSTARFIGPEPVSGFHLIIIIDSEPGLILGDTAREWLSKKAKFVNCRPKFALVSRKEHFYGNALYSTKAKFSDRGIVHDILISCGGKNESTRRNLVLSVIVDEKLVISVGKLEWNFRGNETMYLDGLVVDLMWDVHDWLHKHSNGGAAVFMFRTRGMGSRLWLEPEENGNENVNVNLNVNLGDKDEDDFGFSLSIYAYRNT